MHRISGLDTQARKSAPTPPDFEWDARVQRYRYTSGAGKGQFVSQDALFNLTEKAIARQKAKADELSDRLFRGEVSVKDWELGMANLIRQVSIWEFGLGSGGLGRLNQREYGLIGFEMRFQMGKLRQFSEQILRGNLTEAQIKARANQYFDKAYGLYEQGRLEAHYKAGYRYERRITVRDKRVCPDCQFYASLGWRPIFSLPNPTQQSRCKAQDRCYKEFSRELPQDQQSLPSFGWVGVRSHLKHSLSQIKTGQE